MRLVPVRLQLVPARKVQLTLCTADQLDGPPVGMTVPRVTQVVFARGKAGAAQLYAAGVRVAGVSVQVVAQLHLLHKCLPATRLVARETRHRRSIFFIAIVFDFTNFRHGLCLSDRFDSLRLRLAGEQMVGREARSGENLAAARAGKALHGTLRARRFLTGHPVDEHRQRRGKLPAAEPTGGNRRRLTVRRRVPIVGLVEVPVELGGGEELRGAAWLGAGEHRTLAEGVVLLVQLQVSQHAEGLGAQAAREPFLRSILDTSNVLRLAEICSSIYHIAI